jgi:hypothetical protein
MKKKKDDPQSTLWVVLKSGALRNGDWFASQYMTGWYFVCSTSSAAYKPSSTAAVLHNNLGPFTSFEEGVTAWKLVQSNLKQ